MPDRINPRPIFRNAMSMLDSARCPECNRTFDLVQDAETDCHRMAPLNCSWCAQRQILVHEFLAWQRQDYAAHRKNPRRSGAGEPYRGMTARVPGASLGSDFPSEFSVP